MFAEAAGDFLNRGKIFVDNFPGARGDLLARVMIRVPAQLSDEERQLWEALAAKSSFNPRG